jgi:hypothetical protein
MDFAALNLAAPPLPLPAPAVPPPVPAGRETQLLRRVRELEEEVRVLKVDNDKQVSSPFPYAMGDGLMWGGGLQKAMIAKFRERWEKLKESAKRKKEAKAIAGGGGVGGRRVEEMPQVEEE